ncbi:MAG TPA: hypothetical protein VEP90_00310, partial [Methylomirabilota bacterium]|nr:hypothetical protein [Methylomirabilota bacterium]
MTCQDKSLVAVKSGIGKNNPHSVVRYTNNTENIVKKLCERGRMSYIPALAVPGQHILRDPEALFLFLTQWTVPHRHEGEHYGKMLSYLGFEEDTYGNWFREIYSPNGNSTTAFCAHMDTAGSEVTPIVRNVTKGIVTTNGSSILGADDRAGMTVLLYMLNQGKPGLYCLFVGEEAGCIGSRKASQELTRFHKITKVISFDRRGKTSVITR